MQWSGTDQGSALRDYTIYVSDNGGSFTPWLSNTTLTQSNYSGVNGHTYRFYSIASDLAGNAEATKAGAEASTIVVTGAAYTVRTNPPGLSFVVDGQPFNSAQIFAWTAGSQHTIAVASPQAGAAGTRYVFANWSDGLGISHSVTAPSTATTYTATFITQYLLTKAANPVAGGTVAASPAAAGGILQRGYSVPAGTATVNTGYQFGSWAGAASGSANR